MDTKRSVKISEKTYKEMLELSLFSGVPICRLIDFAWLEFKQTKTYANFMLLGDKKTDKEGK